MMEDAPLWPLPLPAPDPEPTVPTTRLARQPDRRSEERGSFILYVEGPRDRSILRAWAQRLLPERAQDLLEGAVILGGRRPARAVEHFRARAAGSHGLCVLDRDEDAASEPEPQDGLEFFTWTRRHIESYLLVPCAIRRALGLPASDHRLEAVLERELPAAEDVAGWRALDAKRLLADTGPLARLLGRPLPLARIARATRGEELHADVHHMFGRLREMLERASGRRPVGSWRSRASDLI
jgi:hypothetical protein